MRKVFCLVGILFLSGFAYAGFPTYRMLDIEEAGVFDERCYVSTVSSSAVPTGDALKVYIDNSTRDVNIKFRAYSGSDGKLEVRTGPYLSYDGSAVDEINLNLDSLNTSVIDIKTGPSYAPVANSSGTLKYQMYTPTDQIFETPLMKLNTSTTDYLILLYNLTNGATSYSLELLWEE